jgi:hypothetical protein
MPILVGCQSGSVPKSRRSALKRVASGVDISRIRCLWYDADSTLLYKAAGGHALELTPSRLNLRDIVKRTRQSCLTLR